MYILCICGKICSGKDFLSQTSLQYLPKATEILSVSKYVKQLLKTEERTHNNTIDQELIKLLINQLRKCEYEGVRAVVINGIRQFSILSAIMHEFDSVKVVWIECDDRKRQHRFVERNDKKDNATMESYDEADQQLGLDKIEQFIKQNLPDNIIYN